MTTEPVVNRNVYRNIHILEIVRYRLPLAGMVSILHRISGALMFLVLPFVVWAFAQSMSSEGAFTGITRVFVLGLGILPGWALKLGILGLVGAYLFHLVAGLRHLWLDLTHCASKEQGRASALFTLAASALLWLLVGAKLFSLY